MKKIVTIAVLVLFTGCAYQHTADLDPATHQAQTFTQIVLLQKANVEGLKAHQKTKSGSLGFGISKESTETQTEALKAIASGLAEGAVKGAKTP